MAAKRSAPVARAKRWRFVILTAILLSAALIALLALLLPVSNSDELDPQMAELALVQAQLALRNNAYEQAEKLAAAVPATSSLFAQSRLVAGEAATRNHRNEAALKYYSEIVKGDSPEAITSAYAMAEIYRSECQLEPAHASYSHVLAHEPNDAATHERMAFILGVTRQHWEAAPHYLALVKLESWTLDSLAILSDIERSIDQPAFVSECAKKAPEDPLSQLAQAAEKLYAGQTEQAKPLLVKVVAQRPQLLAAQAMLGELLLTDEQQAFDTWNRNLPPSAEDHPDIWFVRGLQSRRDQQLELAAGCFALAAKLAPEHRRATYQLGQMLAQLDAPSADAFVQRAKQQAELGQMLDQVLAARGQDEQTLRRVTELSESLGRLWEAWAWAMTAGKLHPAATWTEPIARRCAAQLNASLPRTAPSSNPLAQHDLSMFISRARSQAWTERNKSEPPPPQGRDLAANTNIRFERERDVGIDFIYNNGADPKTPGARMFEQTGGGVGVIDYDNDGWPDLYFTQGGEWKTSENQPTRSTDYLDCLYRNISGKQFEEVALATRIDSVDFSQGVAVGDYDADGFPDLFVGNIGRNQLWRNNGDGTFTNASQSLGEQEDRWTTSAVLVDLNGDTLLDIFEVTYLQGKDVYNLICGGKGCSPKVFEGEPDQLRLNRGDGTFELVPDACPTQDSKGLGVLAFMFEDAEHPVLFVANDQVANHLLEVEGQGDGKIRLRDDALLRGLAFNADGLPMACMGIAADDVDQNGLLDLLITNFSNEPNTLYMQDSPGLFVDATQVSGMQSASFPYVGWGTQFLDADLDGDSDAVVVNGNIDDYRSEGGEFEMPPQLYKNVGGGRFVVVPPAEGGDYFAHKYLGRAMAKLDWNRDGLVDFVVSNIGSQAALVTNRSSTRASYVNLRLHGTKSARDAIGARITVTADSGVWTKQLVAGDGFQASNERLIQFGLGNATRIVKVEVRWPSGESSLITDVPLNSTLELIEGADSGKFLSPKDRTEQVSANQP